MKSLRRGLRVQRYKTIHVIPAPSPQCLQCKSIVTEFDVEHTIMVRANSK